MEVKKFLKKNYKLVVLVIVVAVSFLLGSFVIEPAMIRARGGKKRADQKIKVNTVMNTDATEADSSDATEADGSDSTEAATDNTLVNSNDKFSFGTIEGNTYENVYLGLGCVLEGWELSSEDDVQLLNETAIGVFNRDDMESVEKGTVFHDMIGAKELDNINITFEKTDAEISEYIEDTIDQVETGLKEDDFEVKITETTAKIDGKKISSFDVDAKLTEKIYKKYLIVDTGDFMATIAITSFEKSTIKDVVNSFYIVE